MVRVVLREIPADMDLQDQVEQAVRRTTGERLEWPALVRSAGHALPVVLLDGFDEMLQATGVSQTDYLVKVRAFQQREAAQGRPVAAVVTSRIARREPGAHTGGHSRGAARVVQHDAGDRVAGHVAGRERAGTSASVA